MGKFVIDFVFDERTGESRIVIDYHDDSLSALEINEAIRSGEMRDQAIAQAGRLFGEEIAARVRDGRIAIVCRDHQPDENQPGVKISQEVGPAANQKDQKQ